MVRILYAKQFQRMGRKIAYYRGLQHWSQAQLAARTGISVSYLSKIERAALDSISLITLLQIADALQENLNKYEEKFGEVRVAGEPGFTASDRTIGFKH